MARPAPVEPDADEAGGPPDGDADDAKTVARKRVKGKRGRGAPTVAKASARQAALARMIAAAQPAPGGPPGPQPMAVQGSGY